MKHVIRNLTLSLLLLLCTPALALQITFQKSAIINTPRVSLGQIATFSEENATSRALGALLVTEAPEPGSHKVLRSVGVRNMLLRNGHIPAGTYWRGPASVVVLRAGQEVTPEQVLKEISNFIADNRANLPQAEIRFIPDTLPPPFKLPEGQLTCEVIPSRPGILRSSRFSLIYRVDGQVVRNTSVRGRVEALAPVVVAKHALRRGQQLSSADFTVEKRDISRLRGVVQDSAAVIGRKLTRGLQSEAPLLENSLEVIPVILKGERVKIIIRSGRMTLSATGTALVDGNAGAFIPVENSNSRKRLRARVEGPGVVSVQM